MNVCWHRPSQKSSAFMYITFRMSSNGTRRVCHLLAGPQRWSHHTHKHQGCNIRSVPCSHISMSSRICCQIQRPAERRGCGAGVSAKCSHYTSVSDSITALNLFYLLTLLHAEKVKSVVAWGNIQCWYVSRPRFIFPFFYLFCFTLISLFNR